MMAKIKLKLFLLALLSVTLFYSCKGQIKKTGNTNIQIQEEKMSDNGDFLVIKDINFDGKDEFIEYIDKERIEFYNVDGRSRTPFVVQYTETSTPYVFPILSHWLEKRGCKAVTDSKFKERLKTIFGIDTIKHKNIFFEKDYIRYDTDEAYLTEGDILTEGSFLFSTKYNLFFRPLFNGDIAEEDHDIPHRYYIFMHERLYHYNNFLFNDDNASLSWLINNDIDFLKLLVKEFGYDKNERINKAVIISAFKQYHVSEYQLDESVFHNLFGKENQNGEFEVRSGLMQAIVDLTTVEDVKYLDWLVHVNTYLSGRLYGNERSHYYYQDLDDQQCLKLMAYVSYYVERTCIDKEISQFPDGFPRFLELRNTLRNEPEILNLIESNNYFGLPDFENMVRQTLEVLENN